MGDLVPWLAFTGNYITALMSLCLSSCCFCYCQAPAQDLVSSTELQKTECKLPSEQNRDQKMTNRQVQCRGAQLFLSSCQTGLAENPTRKSEQSMASDKNWRKTQAASCYLFCLPSWRFPLAEQSWQHPKKPTGRCPLPSSQFGGILAPCKPVYKKVKLSVGDAADSQDGTSEDRGLLLALLLHG